MLDRCHLLTVHGYGEVEGLFRGEELNGYERPGVDNKIYEPLLEAKEEEK